MSQWTGLSFTEEWLRASQGYCIVIIMMGGNDLNRGATHVCFRHAFTTIERQARQAGIRSVIITSLWPRQVRASVHFRERSDRYYSPGDRVISFWQWDIRQLLTTTDGAHLEIPAYRKAIKYLLAPYYGR